MDSSLKRLNRFKAIEPNRRLSAVVWVSVATASKRSAIVAACQVSGPSRRRFPAVVIDAAAIAEIVVPAGEESSTRN